MFKLTVVKSSGYKSLCNRLGYSLLETLLSLFLIALIISGTFNISKYIHALRYVSDSKTVDTHFNRIQRLMAYGNCDSLVGDIINTSYYNTDDHGIRRLNNSFPEIKVRSPIINTLTGVHKKTRSGDLMYSYKVLYAPENNVTERDLKTIKYEPVKTLLTGTNFVIQTMNITRDLNYPNYLILRVVFRRVQFNQKKTQSINLYDPSVHGGSPKSQKGEFERSLRVYVELENILTSSGKIVGCGLNPSICLREDRRISLLASIYTESGSSTLDCETGATNPLSPLQYSVTLEKSRAGTLFVEELIKPSCVCRVQFRCQNGYWNDQSICMRK